MADGTPPFIGGGVSLFRLLNDSAKHGVSKDYLKWLLVERIFNLHYDVNWILSFQRNWKNIIKT